MRRKRHPAGVRLQYAIEKRFGITRTEFAERFGLRAGTVIQHSWRGPPPRMHRFYTKTLRVTVEWLTEGEGDDPFGGESGTATASPKVDDKAQLPLELPPSLDKNFERDTNEGATLTDAEREDAESVTSMLLARHNTAAAMRVVFRVVNLLNDAAKRERAGGQSPKHPRRRV